MIQVKISSLSIGFGHKGGFRHLFRGLTLDIPVQFGETIGLMGESGCGKSTLLRLIAGVLASRHGVIRIDGAPSDSVAFLPQGGVLLEHLSLQDNLRLFSRLKVTRRRFDQARLLHAIDALDLNELVSRGTKVDKLSGGERQRVSLARVLSIKPQLILLDEPCAAIGGDHRTEFLSTLKRSSEELRFGVILASHDWNDHSLIANQIAFMKNTGGDGLSTVPVVPVKEFASVPWHREAVSYTSRGPINWIKAQKIDGCWCLSVGDLQLSRMGAELPLATKLRHEGDGSLLLACGIDNIEFSEENAESPPLEFFGTSDAFAFLRIGPRILIAGKQSFADGKRSIRLTGSIPAYSTAGDFVGILNLPAE
ncbi:ATP-binding cassette domain-containing protein [Bradyrhizobium sp. SZCCHNRI1009]|uniref:ATP-binding cassette domain-containing protein n=1 Tax=Bradyrhizobium sp. SZCCHNRI1009 TaxID=3057277 RepID=UPI00291656B9|nr:ATP-binding cassette domain-containing protein [Bradyrhizobium sp. SZCCHNRI1009]